MATPTGVQTVVGKDGIDKVVRTAEGQIRAVVFELKGNADEEIVDMRPVRERGLNPMTEPYTAWLERHTERGMDPSEEYNLDNKDDQAELKLNVAAVRKLLLCEDLIYRQQKTARIKHHAVTQ
ncbi:hypothetical protein WJX72_006816 [[Myrmecia] bisecta]|uniref:Uncharacterized protein n=1 Tax=[Myrmecia] bisecta TaxID=41462 RepID=A0AAW1PTC6_9CHLO